MSQIVAMNHNIMERLCDCCYLREGVHEQDYDGWAKSEFFCDYCWEVLCNGDRCGTVCEYYVDGVYKIPTLEKYESYLMCFLPKEVIDKLAFESYYDLDNPLGRAVICPDFDSFYRVRWWLDKFSRIDKL